MSYACFLATVVVLEEFYSVSPVGTYPVLIVLNPKNTVSNRYPSTLLLLTSALNSLLLLGGGLGRG